MALVLNGEYSNTFLCTPENLEQLVAGFLMTKGVIKSKDDIKFIEVDFDNRVAHATIEKNEDLDKGKRFYLNDLDYVDLKPIEKTETTIKVSDIYEVMKENLTSSELFKNTGGVHSVAIYQKSCKSRTVFCPSIPRWICTICNSAGVFPCRSPSPPRGRCATPPVSSF